MTCTLSVHDGKSPCLDGVVQVLVAVELILAADDRPLPPT